MWYQEEHRLLSKGAGWKTTHTARGALQCQALTVGQPEATDMVITSAESDEVTALPVIYHWLCDFGQVSSHSEPRCKHCM